MQGTRSMKPDLRRAAHQALDILLDAITDDVPKKHRRGPADPELPPEPEVSPDMAAKIAAKLERAGYRKTG